MISTCMNPLGFRTEGKIFSHFGSLARLTAKSWPASFLQTEGKQTKAKHPCLVPENNTHRTECLKKAPPTEPSQPEATTWHCILAFARPAAKRTETLCLLQETVGQKLVRLPSADNIWHFSQTTCTGRFRNQVKEKNTLICSITHCKQSQDSIFLKIKPRLLHNLCRLSLGWREGRSASPNSHLWAQRSQTTMPSAHRTTRRNSAECFVWGLVGYFAHGFHQIRLWEKQKALAMTHSPPMGTDHRPSHWCTPKPRHLLHLKPRAFRLMPDWKPLLFLCFKWFYKTFSSLSKFQMGEKFLISVIG